MFYILFFLGLQIPNCDRVSFPAKEKLHLVQDLGQKFLRQLSLPHQVYANTGRHQTPLGKYIDKVEQEPDSEERSKQPWPQ